MFHITTTSPLKMNTNLDSFLMLENNPPVFVKLVSHCTGADIYPWHVQC